MEQINQANTLFGWILGIQATILISTIAGTLKLVWYLSKADSRIENAQATAVRAHIRIDKITKDGEGV